MAGTIYPNLLEAATGEEVFDHRILFRGAILPFDPRKPARREIPEDDEEEGILHVAAKGATTQEEGIEHDPSVTPIQQDTSCHCPIV